MVPTRVQFTIRSLMIAIAILAGLLALPKGLGVFVIAFLFPCLSLLAARWVLLQGRRGLAAIGFWVSAILTNILFAASCVAPDIYFLAYLFLGWLFVVLPPVVGFGAIWAILATRKGATPRRAPAAAWLSVLALTVMPLATTWTLWPLRLAFHVSRPSLERLADRVATGQTVQTARWVGPFRVARTAVDPATGNVGLMIDPNPNGPTGFVRLGPGNSPDRRHLPIRGDDLEVDLGEGWYYHEED